MEFYLISNIKTMLQQIIALIITSFFLARLFWQKQKKQIKAGEFLFWLIFWLLAGLAIIFIKQIDKLVAELGFSGSGIEVLFYLAVVILFYIVFRIRIKLAKMEREITRIVREMAINKKDK